MFTLSDEIDHLSTYQSLTDLLTQSLIHSLTHSLALFVTSNIVPFKQIIQYTLLYRYIYPIHSPFAQPRVWYVVHSTQILLIIKPTVFKPPWLITRPGTHFTNAFSIPIKIRWKMYFSIPDCDIATNSCASNTAQLVCHVKKVAICSLEYWRGQNEISTTFDLW